MTHHIGTTNLLKTAAALTASSAETGYEASHLAEPEFLSEPWHSTGTTETTITIDLGAPTLMDRIALFDGNFTLARVEQHTSNVWTSPTFTSGPLAIGRDHYRRHYRRWIERAPLTPYTLRWTRIVIPTQTPTDGLGYFRLGGIWAGQVTALPREPRPNYRGAPEDPRVLLESEGGWRVQYQTGDPVVRQMWQRHALVAAGEAPGTEDEWAEWLDIDRTIAEAGGLFCHFIDFWGPGAVWMMRQESVSAWQDRDATLQEDSWDLYEAVAG